MLAGLSGGDGPPAVSCSLLGLGTMLCVWVGSLFGLPVWAPCLDKAGSCVLHLGRSVGWAPWLCGIRDCAQQLGKAAGSVSCPSGAGGWAQRLPRFTGQASCMVWMTGGYTQQLSGATGLLPCLGEGSRMGSTAGFSPLTRDPHQA